MNRELHDVPAVFDGVGSDRNAAVPLRLKSAGNKKMMRSGFDTK